MDLIRLWAEVRQERLKDAWARGEFSAAFSMEMAVKNAGATGACSILQELQELDYETVFEEVTGEKYVRLDPAGQGSTS